MIIEKSKKKGTVGTLKIVISNLSNFKDAVKEIN